MIRRRLIIEWNDDGTDTDEDVVVAFLRGDWTIEDLKENDRMDKIAPIGYATDLKVWVEDAPTK